MGRKYLFSKIGYSLVELMIVMAITVFVGAAAISTYRTFVSNSTRDLALNELNIDTKIALRLLENDIQIAGFGLPTASRVASDENCPYSETGSNAGNLPFFCKQGSDRLFLSDGTQMLTDVTDNGENDGNIPSPPNSTIDYASLISQTKNASGTGNGGYQASLTNAANTGQTVLSINILNIDFGNENLSNGNTPSNDFIANQALIITDSINQVEGHRIASITGTGPATLTLVSGELINAPNTGSYAANSQVVPAVAWYVTQDPNGLTYSDGTPMYWLYRNQNKVIPNVDNFQVTYGYYAAGGGIVWDNIGSANSPLTGSIPPTTASNNILNPPFTLSYPNNQLKAIKITLTTKFVYRGNTQKTTYQTIVELRN